jgi:hypothetical protein
MRIIVNGDSIVVLSGEISYDDIQRIAFDNRPVGLHAITVHNAEGRDDGVVQPGETVRVKDGTVFNVYAGGGGA